MTIQSPVSPKPSRLTSPLALLVVFILTLTGCGTITKYQTIKELQRVEDAKANLAKNEKDRLERGRDFAYAAGQALDKICIEKQVPEVKVAKLLTDRALLTLGSPDSESALQLKQLVDDLLSENAKLRERGAAELADRDAMIAKLEHKAIALEKTLDKVEDARDATLIKDANKAAQWDAENSFINSINPFHDLWKFIKKLFILALIVGLLGAGLKIAAMFFPALKPLSMMVDGCLGFFGKLVFRAAPAAQQAAGVVAVETHAASEKTLAALVKTVQDLRYDHGDEVKAKVDDALAANNSSDPTIAAKVQAVKNQLRASGADV